MKKLVILMILPFLYCSTGDVIGPTYEPPPDEQCQIIADREHLTSEQRADCAILCDCYELEDGWWRYQLCCTHIVPEACNIPHSEDPGWSQSIRRVPTTLEVHEAAKVVVGERCGENPFSTLKLLAEAANATGECAAGPWNDEFLIKAKDGLYEGWHSVAYTNGCWLGPAYRGTYYHPEG